MLYLAKWCRKEPRKTLGEGEDHYKARLIVFHYLRAIYCSSFEYRVKDVWSHRFRPRADLAVVKLPEIITLIWVEVQDTKLSRDQWDEKIEWASRMCENLLVVITPNLVQDLSMIKDLLNSYKKEHQLFVADPKTDKLFRLTNRGEKMQIEIDESGKTLEKKIKNRLDNFLRS